ncbi:MAG: hypothetical protein WCQ54_03625 [Clostridiaceae bacterium]
MGTQEIVISIFVGIFIVGAIVLCQKAGKEMRKYEKENKNKK